MSANPVLVGLLVVAFLAVGCGADLDIDIGGNTINGSGDVVTTSFDVGDFDRVEVSHAFDVQIVVGSGGPSVEVDIDDNLVDELDVEVSGDTLEIGMRSGSFDATAMRAVVVVDDLRAVDASGATEVTVEGVSSDRFVADASGASSIQVSGVADQISVEASGASDVDLRGLEAEDVEVDASGASSVEIWASASVKGDASGASTVLVEGDASVDVDTSGASSVEVD